MERKIIRNSAVKNVISRGGGEETKKKKKKGGKPPTKIGTTLLEAGNRRRNGEIISHIAQSGRNYVDNGRARVNTRPSKNVCREYPGFDRGLLPPSRGEKGEEKKKKKNYPRVENA